MAKHKTYSISAKVLVRASCEINATSLEDAAKQAAALSITDFVKPAEGQCFDDYEDFEVTSIFA